MGHNSSNLGTAQAKKPTSVILLLVLFFLATPAAAQQKVGSMPEWVTSYFEAYYTLNFVGTAAAARGGSGVALNLGAMSLAANPAAIFPRGRGDFALEIAGLRNNLEYDFLGPIFPDDVRDYSQPALRPGAAAVAMRLGDRAAFGLSLTNPRSYKMHYNIIFTETSYEHPDGYQDYELSHFQQLKQWQTTTAIAVKPLPGFAVGIALDVLSSQVTYIVETDEFPFPYRASLDETFHSYLFRAGLRHEIADFAYGISARTGDRFVAT